MDSSLLLPVERRVAALRRRALIIAGIATVLGLAALGLSAVLGEADAPIGARLFFCAGGLAVAGWQALLAVRIGKGLAAVRAGRTITWIYPLHAYINGAHVASAVMIGLDSGEKLELPSEPGADANALIDALGAAHPRATRGHDAERAARFAADPRSLLR